MTILTNPPLPQQPHEILIHGRLYDVTHFKHPGGSIMKFYSGSGDATEAYDQFHVQLPRANKYLDALPSRPAPTDLSVDVKEQKRLAKLSADFQALFKECQDLGYFKPHIPHIIYRFTELILIHALGLWMLFNAPAFLVPVALLILGVGEGRCGWWMHEAGHYSCTGIPAVDIKIQEIVYGFGDGMSAAWWRVQHNKHHAATQQLGKDADLETLPLVAFNKETAKSGKAHPLVRWWISKQKYMFIPVTCSLVALYWQLFLHPRHILRTHRYTEAVAILSRWLTIAFICHQLEVSFVTGLCCTLLSQMFGAIYIFFTFAMNHSFLPVVGRHERRHHVEHASFAVNLNHHWLVTWWMAFLNFHVEHHLFPSMPQCRFVKLQPKIRSLLECNGIHYDSRPYIETFCTTLKNLGEVAASMYEDA